MYYSPQTYLSDGEMSDDDGVPMYPDTSDDVFIGPPPRSRHENYQRRNMRRISSLPPPSSALMAAIIANNEAAVKDILNGGQNAPPRLHRCRGSGDSPFHAAARSGNVEIGRLLIRFVVENKPNLNPYAAVDRQGKTKTFFATRHRDGRYEDLRRWVDCTAGGWTPIGLAMRLGNVQFALLLINEGGASPTTLTRAGPWAFEAISYAIYHGMTDIFEAFLRTGEEDLLAKGSQRAVDLVLMRNSRLRESFVLYSLRYSTSASERQTLVDSFTVLTRWLAHEKRLNKTVDAPSLRLEKELEHKNTELEKLFPLHFAVRKALDCPSSNMYGYPLTPSFAAHLHELEVLKALMLLEQELCPERLIVKEFIDDLLQFALWDSQKINKYNDYPREANEDKLFEVVRYLVDIGCDVTNTIPLVTAITFESWNNYGVSGEICGSRVLQLLLDAGADGCVPLSLDEDQRKPLLEVVYQDTNHK